MHFPKKLSTTLGSTSAFKIQSYLVETLEYSIAQSTNGAVGATWNPDPDERPNGFPHTYSHQQWFILPDPVARMLLAGADLFEERSEEEATE